MPNVETEPLLQPCDTVTIHTVNNVENPKDEFNPLLASNGTHRRIGWASAYLLVISRVIGSGIFAMPGIIIQGVGSPGLALIMWIIGALIAWCGLAVDLEYGCMLPRSGGMKVYLEFTYPRPRFLASTMIAVQAILLGFTATNCLVFAKYILFALRYDSEDMKTKALAVGLLTGVSAIHGCSYRTGVVLQNVLGWLKIGLIAFMIFTGFLVVVIRPKHLQIPEARPLAQDLFHGSHWDINTLATALLKIFYSYAGLGNVNNVMNEVKNPIRTLKTVGPTALLTTCVLYVLINVAYLAVVPLDEVKHSQELIAALFFEKVFGTGFGNIFLPFTIALCAAGNVMVVIFSVARLNQEIARQGFLPFSAALGSSRPFGTPIGGLIVHYIPSLLVIAVPPSGTVYAFIADVEGYAGQFFILAMAIGILLLRYRMPDLPRPFRAYKSAVVFRIVLCLGLITAPLIPPKDNSDVSFFYAAYALVATSILIFGLAYWAVWTVVLPRVFEYKLAEVKELLQDGSSITRLERQG